MARTHLGGEGQATACGQCAAGFHNIVHLDEKSKATCARCKATTYFNSPTATPPATENTPGAEREALLKIIKYCADISPLWRGKMASAILAAGFTRRATPDTEGE